MKSRVDEPDAEGPKDAAELLFSAPAESHEPDFSRSLDDFFGPRPVHSEEAEAPAYAASRDRLAELFGRTPAAEPDSEIHSTVPDDAPVPDEAVLDETVPEVPAAADEPWAASEPWAAGEPIGEESAVVDDALLEEPWVADEPMGEESAVVDDALLEEPWVEELGLAAIVHDNTEPGELERVGAETMPEAVSYGPVLEEPLTDATAAEEMAADEPPAHEPEPHFAVGPLFSATAAEPRTVTPPVPHSGTFGRSRSRTGVRGALFGSRARTAVSVTASVVLVAAIVGGAAYAAQTIAEQNRLVAAQTSLESAEAAIDEPESALDSAYADYDASKIDARAAADAATPSLAAVAGMTDQATLDAANGAVADLVADLDAGGPPPAPAPYERAAVDSDPDEVAAAARSARDYADEVVATTTDVQAVTAGVKAKMAALTVALNALGGSLPPTAAVIAGENPLAEQSFRDAVVAAADAVGAAQAAGGSGDAELLAYADAVTALRADQARAVEDAAKHRVVTKPRTGTTTPTPAPTTPAPEPSQPAPEPSQPDPSQPASP